MFNKGTWSFLGQKSVFRNLSTREGLPDSLMASSAPMPEPPATLLPAKKGLCFTSVQPRNHHPVPKTAHVALLLLQSPVMGLLSFCIWAAPGVKLDLFRISHQGVSRLSLSGLSLLECSHPSSSHPTLLALSSLVFKLGSAHSSVTGLFLLCKVGLNLAPNLLSASQAEAMGSGQLDYKPNTPATLFEEINTD